MELELSLPTASGVATYPPGATFGPRTMRDYEFVWIIEGEVEYRWGAQSVAAPSGAIVLCRPGAVDFFRWDPRQRTRHGYFHFNILAAPRHWPPQAQWPLVRLPEEGDVLRPLFRYLLTWAGHGDPEQQQLTMATLLTAFLTGEIASGDVPRETLPEAVERAWAYIHRRLEDEPAAPIGLAELAGVACVTPEHLCRLFTASLGRSPVETVRLARLDRAAVLLARSNYAINEIAALCGFASPFHFSRRFREAFGQSPSALRKAIQAGATPPTPRLLRFECQHVAVS
jgi:AraC-like DNA-binding protein